jgi:hypothetical protein
MKIKFTHDFRGKLTRELFYTAGAELDVDDDVGRELIALHHAVEVAPPPLKPAAKRPPKRKASADE